MFLYVRVVEKGARGASGTAIMFFLLVAIGILSLMVGSFISALADVAENPDKLEIAAVVYWMNLRRLVCTGIEDGASEFSDSMMLLCVPRLDSVEFV